MSPIHKEYYLLSEAFNIAIRSRWPVETANYFIKVGFLSFASVIVIFIVNTYSLNIPYMSLICVFLFLMPLYLLMRNEITSMTNGDIVDAIFVKKHTDSFPRRYISYEFNSISKTNDRSQKYTYTELYNNNRNFITGNKYRLSKHKYHNNFAVPINVDLVVDFCMSPTRRHELLPYAYKIDHEIRQR